MTWIDFLAAVLQAAAPLLLVVVLCGKLEIALRLKEDRDVLYWGQAAAFIGTGLLPLLYKESGFEGWFDAHAILAASALLLLPTRFAIVATVGLISPLVMFTTTEWPDLMMTVLLGAWALVARHHPAISRLRDEQHLPWRWALLFATGGAFIKLAWANFYTMYHTPANWTQTWSKMLTLGLARSSLASFGLSVLGLFGVAAIYLSRQAWAAQASSLLRYRDKVTALLAMIPDTVLLWDQAYRVKSVLVFGTELPKSWLREQLPGMGLDAVFPAEVVPELLATLERVRHEGLSLSQVVTFESGYGRLRHLEIRWQPHPKECVLSLVRDVTDSVLLRQQQTAQSAEVLAMSARMPDLTGFWGPLSGTVWLSSAALLRFTQGRGLSRLEDLLSPEDLHRLQGALEQVHKDASTSITLSCSLGTRVGVRTLMELTLSQVTPPFEHGDAKVLFVGKDVTQEVAARNRMSLYAQAVSRTTFATAVLDEEDGRIVWASERFYEVTGFSEDEALGHSLDKLLRSTASHAPMPTTLELALSQPWHGRFSSRTKSGTWLPEWREVSFFEDFATQTAYHVVTLHPTNMPIGQGLCAFHEQTQVKPLPCVQDFIGQAEPLLAAHRQQPALVAVFGAYGWESLHRSRGSDVMDSLIDHARQRLSVLSHFPVVVTKIAYDRMALLFIGEGASALEPAAQVLTDESANPPWFGHATLRLGYARRSTPFQPVEELLENATYAFDKACRPTASAVVSHSSELEAQQRAKKACQDELQSVLEQQRPLELRFEAVHSLSRSRLVGAWVRLGWQPEFEESAFTPSPLSLLSSVEQADDLSYQTLRQMCLQAQAWARLGRAPLRTALELDALQLLRRPFVERLASLPPEHGVFASLFVLEIRTTHPQARFPAVNDAIVFLRNKGFQVLLGDVGFSQTALSLLERLPWTGFSLDQGLVQSLAGDSAMTEVCRSLIQRAAAMNLAVIAKGVSSAQQVELLNSLGCHAAYGPWMGSLVTSEELLALNDATEDGEGVVIFKKTPSGLAEDVVSRIQKKGFRPILVNPNGM